MGTSQNNKERVNRRTGGGEGVHGKGIRVRVSDVLLEREDVR